MASQFKCSDSRAPEVLQHPKDDDGESQQPLKEQAMTEEEEDAFKEFLTQDEEPKKGFTPVTGHQLQQIYD